MSLLKNEPSGVVESIEELFAIAHAMEQEAATRYEEIAIRLTAEGNPSLAAVFERLSREERGHLESVVHWSEKQKGKAPDSALVRWTPPETFDDEGASTSDASLLTAYRSLAMAVRNEERAFAFWSYVAAQARTPDIQRAAETMAHEELEHVATLRRERRRAYHAERSPGTEAGAGEHQPIDAVMLEGRLAEELDAMAEAAGPAEASRLRQLAAEARRNAAEIARDSIEVPGGLAPRSGVPTDAVAIAELLVDRYLDAADRLNDEAAVARAQDLAGRAISRLTWVRSDLPEVERR